MQQLPSPAPKSEGATPAAAPSPSLPGGMQKQMDSLQMKQFLIRTWKYIVISVSVLGLLLLVISWAVAVKIEGDKLHRRHVASIIGFILAGVTVTLEAIALRSGPYPILLYSIQFLSVVSLMVNSISMGMNNLVVDICASKDPILSQGSNIHCAAHYLEFSGCLMLLGAMISIFTTTQQSVVVFVDKGILRGIGTRLSSG